MPVSLLQPSYAATVEPIEADRIVAVVGTDVITYVDLRTRLASALKQLQKQGTPLPPQDVLERQMLERLIMDRAQLQMRARIPACGWTMPQLDQAIGRIAAGNKLTCRSSARRWKRMACSTPASARRSATK